MDHQLRKMITLFNERNFFEFHQAAEDLYLQRPEQDKPFFEALVQLGAACHLFCDLEEVQGPAEKPQEWKIAQLTGGLTFQFEERRLLRGNW